MTDHSPLPHIFFHIYAAGQWKQPVQDFIRIFRSSKLIDYCHPLRIGIVGSDEQYTEVFNYLVHENLAFDIIAHERSGWEQVTQNKMHAFAQTNDGPVLYCHTKGASRQDGVNELWRRSMYYYNIGQWKVALQKLTEGIDAVGQHWMYPTKAHPEHAGSPFFGGTVWWTTFKHIREIGAPPMFQRHDAEGWIGYSKGFNMKVFDFTGHISAHPCHAAWTEITQDWAK